MKASKLNKIKEEIQLLMICVQGEEEELKVQLFDLELQELQGGIDIKVEELLDEYKDIFEEPKVLPPFRANHNHQIPLLEGSNPVNQRPYRYAVYQKNEIAKMVQNLLDDGTIQTS